MAISEAMVSSAPTIDAGTSPHILNAVTTRTARDNGVRSSLSTRLVNQRKPKPASKEKRRQLGGGLALHGPTVTLAWLFICRRSHSTQCKLAAAMLLLRRRAA